MVVSGVRRALDRVRGVPCRGMILRAAVILVLLPGAAGAAERRCGWLENPTPANVYLTDRQGEWVMGEQGGHQAIGLDEVPDLSTGGWVETNGGYGYGCACVTGTFDARRHQVVRIDRAEAVPLARCTADRTLPAP